MAGDWIKAEHTLPDKPEVVAMSARLNIDQDAVVGKLIRLWVWADQQSANGNGLSVTKIFIDRITLCPGFSDALNSVGWLLGSDGAISFPNFDRHNGTTAKARASTNRRVKAHRSGNGSVTPPPLQKALPEKRREEIKEVYAPSDAEPLYCDFAGCNEAILVIHDPDAGVMLDYRDDPLRWQWLWITWWNTLPRVIPYGHPRLDSHAERELIARLQERDWDWRTAGMNFPVNFPEPALGWFLKKGKLQEITGGVYKIRNFEKTKGKRNDRTKGPNNRGSTYNAAEASQDVLL